jgi:hypothetical protein
MPANSLRKLLAAALALTALSIAGGLLATPPHRATPGASAPLPSQVIDGLLPPDVDARVDGESIELPDDGGSTAD